MPAVSSSPVPSGLERLARTPSPQPLPDAACLARFLAGLPDPRDRRGRRLPLNLDYPDARRALRVMRRRKDLTSDKITIERLYFVTSLPPGAASGARITAWIRGHWKIENQLHHARDTTFAEDASTIRAGRPPRVMASLRNLAISVCRRDGRTDIAAVTRHHARRPGRPLAALGWT